MDNSPCDGCDCANITTSNKSSTINYLANIASTKDTSLHILKWNNAIIMRECDIQGNLLDLRQSKETLKN